MVESVATGFRQCGTRVRVEQKNDDQKSNQRPDIFAVINNIPTFIDVGIVQPSATSYRGKGPLVRTREYAKEKTDKYKELVMENDARFLPFIIESNGGYGEHAEYVLDDMKVMAHEEALAFAPSQIVRDVRDAVAIAVQKGNAMTCIASYEMTTHVRYEQRVSKAQLQLSLVETDDEEEEEDDDNNNEPDGGHDELIHRSSMLQPVTVAAAMVECIG